MIKSILTIVTLTVSLLSACSVEVKTADQVKEEKANKVPVENIDDTADVVKNTEIKSIIVTILHPAYFTVTSVSADLSKEYREELESQAKKDPASEVYSFEDYQKIQFNYFEKLIKYNEYPDVDLEIALIELVQKYPNQAFGITWNGGIALTYGDYLDAQDRLKSFEADPEAYKQNKLDQSQDPMHPNNHLIPLLGT